MPEVKIILQQNSQFFLRTGLTGILFVILLNSKGLKMKKEEIHLWDIKRILLGQAPPEFLLEVLIRALIMYVAAIVLMRYLGKRMNGQLTILELSVIVVMGATISVPMQIPDRGIVQGFVVLICIFVFLRGVNWIGLKSPRFEKLVHGEASILVKDGVINLKELNRTKITQQQLFEVLRTKKIFQLGKIKRMYLEACGIFSIYPETEEKPGLPIFPPDDKPILEEHTKLNGSEVACTNCGYVKPHSQKENFCRNCGNNEWTTAII
jgi:uncharacterized membrane protein YcaP (DUF421 family)